MAKGNWFDHLIGFFSPRAKFKRLQYKKAGDTLFGSQKRKYEGASVGRRTDDWFTPSLSANTEIARDLFRLRARSRDLVRNNAYASRGIDVIVNNTVGKGIINEIQIVEQSRPGRPRAAPSPRERELKQLWNNWARTTACDYEGRKDLVGLQRQALRAVAESGEVLIRRRRTRRRFFRGPDGIERPVPPVQLQILEADHLDARRMQVFQSNGNKVILGIEFSEDQKRLGYWIFRRHPGAFNTSPAIPLSSQRTIRIPATNIIHMFRADRPGQIRGVPWLAPIIIRLRDIDKYEDFQLVRQQVAACFSVFVKDIEAFDANQTQTEKELLEKIEPGMIECLPPGKDVTFGKPPEVENYKEYMQTLLHSIASGLGISYEALTTDYSDVNFSSARMGHLEFSRNIDSWRCEIMLPQMLNTVFDWFLEGTELLGVSTQNAVAKWTPPARVMVDPTKEVPAIKDAIRAGLMTQSEAIRQQGVDPETFYQEKARDDKRLDSLELVLDSDPRQDADRISAENMANAAGAQESDSNTSEDSDE